MPSSSLLRTTRYVAERAIYEPGPGPGGGGGSDSLVTIVWVSSVGGSDASGNGSDEQPYATIGKALTTITDATAIKPYAIWVAPGLYGGATLVLKSNVAIVNPGALGDVQLTFGTWTFDPSFTDGQFCEVYGMVTNDPGIVGDQNKSLVLERCITENGLTVTNLASLGLYNNIIAGLGATITDVSSVFSRLSSWEGIGGVSFVSTASTADITWDVDQDRFIFGMSVSSTSGFRCDFSGDGDLQGPVTLTGPLATFEGTITFGGTSLVLAGGALVSQYVLIGGGNGTAGQVPVASGAGTVAWTSVSPMSGRFLKSTVLSNNGNLVTSAQTNTVRLRGVGGGGAGGGCTSVAAAAGAAGGGGAGAYIEKVVTVLPSTNYAYTSGAPGAGVSGAGGGNGGDSTFVIGATTYTAPGGQGAPVATASIALTANSGGNGGAVATNGDLNSGGQPGSDGVVLAVAGTVGASGDGAASQFGAGGNGLTAVGNGNAATGFGAGGGGALTGVTTARTGGNGTGGCWIVDEYS